MVYSKPCQEKKVSLSPCLDFISIWDISFGSLQRHRGAGFTALVVVDLPLAGSGVTAQGLVAD